MNRRAVAALVTAAVLLVLLAVVVVVPVPYVAMSPGPTVNVLGERGGHPIVDVQGRRTYPTTGQLRLTTVSVTNPTSQLSLLTVMRAWLDPDRAVYPRDAIYPPEQTASQIDEQNSVDMVSSQDTAVAAALTELGFRPKIRVEVLGVQPGAPAEGKLEARDQILAVNGTAISNLSQVSDAVQRSGTSRPTTFRVDRSGRTRTVQVTATPSPQDKKRAVVGIQVGNGYTFPFDVSVRLGDGIGGPSAGLIFSLAIYDALTPGALTGGTDIAGTGTISDTGRVGPIGGIEQKIVAAAAAGAKIFLVPPGNCSEALAAPVDASEIRLVKAPSTHSAITSLRAYDADHGAPLPSCR